MSETVDIQTQLAEINRKLDILTQQAEYLERKRIEREDLYRDLQVIGEDIYRSVVMELEEVSSYFTSTDLLYLIKKLLRNTRMFIRMLDQVESAADFLEDFKVVSQKMFLELMYSLDSLDKRGYFIFFRRLIKLLDRAVELFNEENIETYRDNIENALRLFKNFLEKDGIRKIDQVLERAGAVTLEKDGKISLFQLYREFNKPEVKRTLVWLLRVLGEISVLFDTNGKDPQTEK